MKTTIEASAAFLLHQPPQTDKSLGTLFPQFGPFSRNTAYTEELIALQAGQDITLPIDTSFLLLALTGAATLEWDYAAPPLPATYDNELRFCGFGPCPIADPAVVVILPVCDIRHIRVTAGAECGVQYELIALGV